MSYPLRLPPQLDLEARERCARLGISLNAFIAVALDAYLRGGAQPGDKPPPGTRRRKARAAAPVKPAEAVGTASGSFEPWLPDPDDWRAFHSPHMWPWADPDWKCPAGLNEEDIEAVEAAYWATHERPS